MPKPESAESRPPAGVLMQRYNDSNQPVGKPERIPESEIGSRMFAGYRQVEETK